MQLQTLLVAAVALLAGVDACKCVGRGGKKNGDTKACCNQLNGQFRGGDDCEAGSISEHLSNFRSCCRGKGPHETSDCDFPSSAAAQAAMEAESD